MKKRIPLGLLFISFFSALLLHAEVEMPSSPSTNTQAYSDRNDPSANSCLTITAQEYCDFLNQVAPSDCHHLYDTLMGSDPLAGSIVRLGDAGNYSYEVIAGCENKPVYFTCWLDQARYCNWLEHGSPTSDQDIMSTENGVYDLEGVAEDALCVEAPVHDQAAICWIAEGDADAKAGLSLSFCSSGLPFLITMKGHASPLSLNVNSNPEAKIDSWVGGGTGVGTYLATVVAYSMFLSRDKDPALIENRENNAIAANSTSKELIYPASCQTKSVKPAQIENTPTEHAPAGNALAEDHQLEQSTSRENSFKSLNSANTSSHSIASTVSTQSSGKSILKKEGSGDLKKQNSVRWADQDAEGNKDAASLAQYVSIEPKEERNILANLNDSLIDIETRLSTATEAEERESLKQQQNDLEEDANNYWTSIVEAEKTDSSDFKISHLEKVAQVGYVLLSASLVTELVNYYDHHHSSSKNHQAS